MAPAEPPAGDVLQPVLDLGHLRAQTFHDRDLEREVLELYLRQSADLLAAIERGPHRAEAAHKLLGSSRGIGAVAVAKAAEAAERTLLADPGAPAADLGALRRAVAATHSEIRRHTAP